MFLYETKKRGSLSLLSSTNRVKSSIISRENGFPEIAWYERKLCGQKWLRKRGCKNLVNNEVADAFTRPTFQVYPFQSRVVLSLIKSLIFRRRSLALLEYRVLIGRAVFYCTTITPIFSILNVSYLKLFCHFSSTKGALYFFH